MKHLNKILLVVMTVMAISSHAQNSNNPWALSFGANAVDTRTSAGGGKNDIDAAFSQSFLAGQNWNILPSISYLSVSRYIGHNLSAGIQGSVNKIDKWVVFDPTNPGHNSTGYAVVDPGELMYYGVDAKARYSFMSLIKSKVIDPSISLGGGYTWFGDNSYLTANAGVGLTFWLTEYVGFEYATTYKASFGDRELNGDIYTPDSPSHFQHTFGLVFQFGGKDTDSDGIYDKDDACPEVAGLKQFNGCPDTDGDGIVDGSDACSDVFGLAELSGCPDADADGIADKDDACPDVKGLVKFKGCPDTDGDGIIDGSDTCPNEAGPASNSGCPILDADADGVNDKEDECPTVAGPASNKGCPEVTEEVVEELKIQAKSVFFNSGKATFKSGDATTIARLDAIKEILKKYPNAKWSIEGHTDNTGSDKVNKKISEERANAIKAVLVENGIPAENLSTVGYGSSKPVASNKTAAGRAENRRTEVVHVGSTYEGKL